MIVFLEIPPVTAGFAALSALLPPGDAGWLGSGDVSACRVVGTGLPLAEAVRLLPGARLFTVMLHEPVSALAQRWTAAAEDPADPAHAMANTFNAGEAAILDLPEAAVGALVRHLSADAGMAAPDAVAAHMSGLPMLVGFVQNPFAYGVALDHLLGLPQRTVDPFALAPRVLPLPRPVRQQIAGRMAADLALHAALLALRGEGRLWRSPLAAAAAAAAR